MKHLYLVLVLALLVPTCAHAQAPAPDPVAQAIAAYEKARADLLAQKAAVIAAEARERDESAKRLAAFAEQLKSIDSALGSVPGPKPPEPLTPGAEVVADLLATKVAAYPGKVAAAQRLSNIYALAALRVPTLPTAQRAISDITPHLQAVYTELRAAGDLPKWDTFLRALQQWVGSQDLGDAAKVSKVFADVAAGLGR